MDGRERESAGGDIGGGAIAGLVRTSPEFVDTTIPAINGHGKTTGREREGMTMNSPRSFTRTRVGGSTAACGSIGQTTTRDT